jgi:hypothetical protein
MTAGPSPFTAARSWTWQACGRRVVRAVHLGFVRGALQRLQDGTGAEGRISHQIEPDQVRLTPVLDGSGPCLVTLSSPEIRSPGD